MILFLFYLLKITIFSAILFGYYWLFLRNKVFNNYNRFYLLFTVFISLCFPLFTTQIFTANSQHKNATIKVLKAISDSNVYMDEIVIGAKNKSNITLESGLFIFYIIVSIFLLAMLIKMFFKVYKMYRNNPKQLINNTTVIFIHNEPSTPFSFLNLIFWNSEIDINTEDGKSIFAHEMAHITQKHSWDKILVSIVITIFWCNPIFWLIRKELSMIHEFIADKKAIATSNKADFSKMILATIFPTHSLTITNHFFHSPIKRRIMMLTKQQQYSINYISRILMLPILFILFAAFSFRINGNKYFTKTNKQITVVLDAGHGGKDDGAVSGDGVKEKDINLALIKAIQASNTNKNIKIILSRKDDVFMNVHEKAAFANEHQPDIFISVHVDSAPEKSVDNKKGMCVNISNNEFENSEKSKLLASYIIGTFKNNYSLSVAENPQQRKQGIYVLQTVKAPSVLIEAGFITNKNDLQYLQSTEGQNAFAVNILNAINNYATAFIEKNTSLNEQPLSDTLYYLDEKIVDKTYWHNHEMSFKKLYIDILNTKEKKAKYGINYEGLVIYARTENKEIKNIEKKMASSSAKIIFTKVETEAEFPGGVYAWKKYLQKNLDASSPVEDGWKPGCYTLILRFIVEDDGSLKDIVAENYTDSKTAKKCVDLITKGPKWIPAKQNGYVVTAYRRQPITFIVANE